MHDESCVVSGKGITIKASGELRARCLLPLCVSQEEAMFKEVTPNEAAGLPTEMKLQYRSIGLSPDQFERLKSHGVGLQDLRPGHYVMVSDWGRQRSANDLHVLSVGIDHFTAHNPGREETSDFYFGKMNASDIKYQLGRDYFLIPAEKYNGPTEWK